MTCTNLIFKSSPVIALFSIKFVIAILVQGHCQSILILSFKFPLSTTNPLGGLFFMDQIPLSYFWRVLPIELNYSIAQAIWRWNMGHNPSSVKSQFGAGGPAVVQVVIYINKAIALVR